MREVQAKLDYADAIADWFIDIGEAHGLRGDWEESLKCTHIAASILSRQNRSLSSTRLESNLRFVASRLAERCNFRRPVPLPAGQKEVCLHVLGEAIPAGGLTAMAIRWMKNDRNERIQSVALLSQNIPIPGELIQAVGDTGGSIYTANRTDDFLQRAIWLKNLANDVASYVVLHIDVSDVICGVAFGTKGGPPVLLVNHTAHTFWTGASMVDLVLNCRGSALEGLWSAKHRGISRYATVPIPLLEPDPQTLQAVSGSESKYIAKKIVGIPIDSVVILTVGAAFKYLPLKDLDFVTVCESILNELPEAYLLVVGFDADSRWKAASRRVGSRIRTLGTITQDQLALVHQAADVYIEGFPFGTTTALLEAGLKRIPVVLAPAQCPPPYGSDGVALDDTVKRPRTIEEYKSKIIQLSRNRDERALYGDQISYSIAKHHTGSGWRQYLEDAIAALPHEHSTYPAVAADRTSEAIHEYWATLMTKKSAGYEETLENSVTHAISMGLRPRLTPAVLRACKDYKSVRARRTIPLPLLILLCNYLLPVLPTALAHKIFRIIAFLFRGHLLSRVRRRVVGLFGRNDGPTGYEGYRQIRGCPELFGNVQRNASDSQQQA